MYYPRLAVDLSSRDTPEPIPSIPAGQELEQRVSKLAGIELNVKIQDRTAFIDAATIPAESLELVRTLLSFEPGIDRVEIAGSTRR
jgi:hypothetical protein